MITTTDRKKKLAQLILFNSILIYGSQSIVATSAPQLAKSKNIVVELTIRELLANERIEVPISTTRSGRGVNGGGVNSCSHCNRPSTRYFYGLHALQQKKEGVVVQLTLEATF